MVDFALSPREQEIFNKAMEFTRKHVIPNSRELEEAKDFPWDLAQKAYLAGLMNSHVQEVRGTGTYNVGGDPHRRSLGLR